MRKEFVTRYEGNTILTKADVPYKVETVHNAGVPVIAYDHGSCREVVADGETGFLVTNVNEAVEAVKKIDTIDRAAYRKHVEEKFSIPVMVQAYEKVYLDIFKLEDEK